VKTWELLPQEVTWQEAIQAWLVDRKEFYVEVDDEKYTQRVTFKLGAFIAGKDGFDRRCFERGKWYIKE